MIPLPIERLARLALQVILICCLLLPIEPRGAHAQFTRFDNYADDQGLGNASVSALAQDADGYILLGTDAGLYRYDGSSISPYDVAVGLPSGALIRKIVSDVRGRVWVMTLDGLYVRTGSRFSKVRVGSHLDFDSPHLLAVSGDAVVIDDGGMLLRAPLGADTVGSFSPVFDRATLAATPALDHAHFVAADADGALLVGCGVAICRVRSGRVTVLGLADGLPADTWQVALRTQDGTLWARSLDRLAWRRKGRSSFDVVTIPGRRGHFNVAVPDRLDLLADRRGGVLTQGEEGLLDYDGRTWRIEAPHDGGLSANPAQSLMFDREGSLWVGSIGRGAFRSLGLGTWEHWTTQDGLPSDIVWAMTRLRGGQLWVATYNDTVPLDRKSEGVPGGSENLASSRQGRLWLAPLRAPLARLDPARGRLDRFPAGGNVASIYVDAGNRLWLSTDKALLTGADADAPATDMHLDVAIPQPAIQVTTDRSGVTWAATANGIFRRTQGARFERVIPSALLPGQVGGLVFAANGDLWVFTDSAGVLRFRPGGGRFETLPSITVPTIGSSNILFLHRDRRGRMWVGTDHGIDMYDGRSWRRFDISDGLISDDMDQSAVFEDTDGSMWFGTSRGLTHLLDPAHLPPIGTLHPLITGLSIGRRSLPYSPSIRTDWSNAPLTIRFVDLDFARGRNVVFRYRLRGLDQVWNDTTEHEVRYASLPAGKLHFELVAIDRVHGSLSAPIRFTLHIRAPWWRRWWFYGCCVIAAAAAVAGTWQARMRLLLRQQRRLEKQVGERTAEIEQARSELQRLAMSDALTGLPNRRAIMRRLEEAVAASASSGTPLAVLICDIDHFKRINDGYGHLAGDAVLATFGSRLTASIEPPEAAGRYGGEEFCVILPAPRTHVLERVATIRAAISEAPYALGNANRFVTSSGGLAFLHPDDNALSLLARADIALYRAKENGRNRIEEEKAGDGDGLSASRQEDLERDLRAALTDAQFVLHYQPVVDIDRDVVTSCEALLRWHSPARGKVPPVEFIPFAERIGLMPEIGDWVLRTACREAAGWPDRMRVSVNLSAVQFRLPDIVARVAAALAETGLPPGRLELEVTETAMIDELATANAVLGQLRALGIAIALDDFGTGYSSLSFLRTLPFDRIKIDRSFVKDLGTTPEAAVIVRAIAGMSRSLGAAVTAEGVESDEQLEALRLAGCSEVQGYRIGRPCSASDLQEWMAAFAASRASKAELQASR